MWRNSKRPVCTLFVDYLSSVPRSPGPWSFLQTYSTQLFVSAVFPRCQMQQNLECERICVGRWRMLAAATVPCPRLWTLCLTAACRQSEAPTMARASWLCLGRRRFKAGTTTCFPLCPQLYMTLRLSHPLVHYAIFALWYTFHFQSFNHDTHMLELFKFSNAVIAIKHWQGNQITYVGMAVEAEDNDGDSIERIEVKMKELHTCKHFHPLAQAYASLYCFAALKNANCPRETDHWCRQL